MNPAATLNPCQRCGQCCEKGGPSLHREDRPLVDDGRIPARCLFTIRRGELARDNVKRTLAPLAEEIIKIKGQAGKWTCRYYIAGLPGCGIYAYRPIECRVLNCRDTRLIEAIYESDRLTRQDLLSGIGGLWELVEDHERRCSYAGLHARVREGTIAGRLKQEKAILEILGYDAHVRQLAVEKGGLDPRMLDFIFGRSLADTVKMFDIRLVKQNGGVALALTPGFSRNQQR